MHSSNWVEGCSGDSLAWEPIYDDHTKGRHGRTSDDHRAHTASDSTRLSASLRLAPRGPLRPRHTRRHVLRQYIRLAAARPGRSLPAKHVPRDVQQLARPWSRPRHEHGHGPSAQLWVRRLAPSGAIQQCVGEQQQFGLGRWLCLGTRDALAPARRRRGGRDGPTPDGHGGWHGPARGHSRGRAEWWCGGKWACIPRSGSRAGQHPHGGCAWSCAWTCAWTCSRGADQGHTPPGARSPRWRAGRHCRPVPLGRCERALYTCRLCADCPLPYLASAHALSQAATHTSTSPTRTRRSARTG